MPRISPGIPGVLLNILLQASSGEVLRSQTAPKDGKVFDSVDVSLGFVRVTVPDASRRPVPGDFEVKWKGKIQRVVDVIGGPEGSAEIGIAIDQSASMGDSFEGMRSEVLDFVENGIANDDSLFVVTFADKLRTVATGRAAALRELRALSAGPAADTGPTAFFDSLHAALGQFENASSRTALIVASDACDTRPASAGSQRLLNRAADLAIPIVLLSPGRGECRNTTCAWVEPGRWECSSASTPTVYRMSGSPTPKGVIFDLSSGGSPFGSLATVERDRFIRRLQGGGGKFWVARSADEWRKALDSVRELLSRQWTVVFEPSSPAVRSSEVKVSTKIQRSRVPPPDAVAAKTETTPRPVDPSSAPASTSNDRQLAEKVEVEVVNVDVVVTDKRGRPILDFARGEFELEVDRKIVPIEYFSAPRNATASDAPPTESPSAPTAGTENAIYVVFDISAMEHNDLRQLVAALESFLEVPAKARSPVLIASYSTSMRIHARRAIGAAEIRRALHEVRELGARGALRKLAARELENELRSGTRTIDHLVAQISILEDEEILRQRTLLSALQDLVATEARDDGRKILLLATPGFSTEPGRYLRDVLRAVAGYRLGEAFPRNDGRAAGNFNVIEELEKLTRTSQDSRLTVYAITPAATTSGPNSAEFRVMAQTAAATPRDTTASDSAANLGQLADSTGGRSFAIHSNLGDKLESIHDDSKGAYSLGFATGVAAGFEPHSIRVRLERPGLTVRSRTSYRRRSVPERQGAALLAATRSGIVDRSIALELQPESPLPAANGSKTRRIPILLRVPLAALHLTRASDEEPAGGRLRIQLAVNDSRGGYHSGPVEIVEVSLSPAELAKGGNSFWAHRIEIELSAGEAGIGALVVDETTGEWATAACLVEASRP